MKEHPILMNGAMVRAVLDGGKTQTRRVMKPQPTRIGTTTILEYRGGLYQPERLPANSNLFNHCPYGQAGDRIWVRETFSDVYGAGGDEDRRKKEVMYRANGETDPYVIGGRWTPSIHMPRWASRILLEIVSVRVERLQDISDTDIVAEGIGLDASAEAQDRYDIVLKGSGASGRATLRTAWRDLWESTGGDWDANEWLWVIEFKRITP